MSLCLFFFFDEHLQRCSLDCTSSGQVASNFDILEHLKTRHNAPLAAAGPAGNREEAPTANARPSDEARAPRRLVDDDVVAAGTAIATLAGVAALFLDAAGVGVACSMKNESERGGGG